VAIGARDDKIGTPFLGDGSEPHRIVSGR
jgi:hypothetical protein